MPLDLKRSDPAIGLIDLELYIGAVDNRALRNVQVFESKADRLVGSGCPVVDQLEITTR